MLLKLFLWLGTKFYDGIITYNHLQDDRVIGILFYRTDTKGENRDMIEEHIWEKDNE